MHRYLNTAPFMTKTIRNDIPVNNSFRDCFIRNMYKNSRHRILLAGNVAEDRLNMTLIINIYA